MDIPSTAVVTKKRASISHSRCYGTVRVNHRSYKAMLCTAPPVASVAAGAATAGAVLGRAPLRSSFDSAWQSRWSNESIACVSQSIFVTTSCSAAVGSAGAPATCFASLLHSGSGSGPSSICGSGSGSDPVVAPAPSTTVISSGRGCFARFGFLRCLRGRRVGTAPERISDSFTTAGW